MSAHRLNAFVMASAAIPVYLLARRVGVGRLVSLWVASLAIATPWMVLSSFLLTEVVAYPAFCWSLLALSVAVERKSVRFDVVALASIGVAILARTQFAVLLVVFGVAVIAEAMLESAGSGARGREIPRAAARNLARTRRVLLGVYAVGAVALIAALIIRGADAVLGSYAVTASDIRVDLDLVRLTAEHLAALALATAILPFVVGSAWLVDRLRPSAPPAARALASVGCATHRPARRRGGVVQPALRRRPGERPLRLLRAAGGSRRPGRGARLALLAEVVGLDRAARHRRRGPRHPARCRSTRS